MVQQGTDDLPGFLSAGGEMGRRIGEMSSRWAALGPCARWPPALRTVTGLLLAAEQPMCLVWGAARSLLFNQAFARLLGERYADALGRPVGEVWPAAWEPIGAALNEAYAGRSAALHSLHSLHRGEPSCHRLALTPVRDEHGVVVGVLGVCSEQVPADRALLASEQRFQQLANLGPSLVWFGNPDGSLSFFNERWYAYTGLTPEQALPFGWVEVVHPQDIERLLQAWAHARHTGALYEIEVQLRRHDGVYRWFLIRALPVRDEQGRITAWLGSNTDIDERKRMETALRSERERIWTYSTDLMLIAHFDGRIQALNPAWEALLDYSLDELMRATVLELVHPDDRPRTLAELGRLSQGYRTLHFEVRVRHRDGSYRDVSWTAVPEGGLVHAIGRDITAGNVAAERLRQAEDALRQAQKMEAVGQLTGGIAHDFNNLLQGITGSLELLRVRLGQGRLGDAERFVSSAMASAERAAALTHRLLAFSRRQSLVPKPVAGNVLVRSMLDLLCRTLGEQIRLRLDLAEDLWLTRCDPNQLESALLNLVINARDAMPGGGELSIATRNASLDQAWGTAKHEIQPGDYVCFTVRDSGSGMTPEVLAHAFEPFFTTKPLGQGTGLGLAMIYGFTHQSEGCVVIDSAPGRGTTVRLYLPRYQGVPPLAPTAEKQPQPAERAHGRVLVVEDQAVLRAVLIEQLEELGYSTLEAVDGPSGLAILQSAEPLDVLVTDIGLPGFNGRQMVDQARRVRPELPVLFMTGYAERAALAGAVLDARMDLITKPFALDELIERLRKLLER